MEASSFRGFIHMAVVEPWAQDEDIVGGLVCFSYRRDTRSLNCQ